MRCGYKFQKLLTVSYFKTPNRLKQSDYNYKNSITDHTPLHAASTFGGYLINIGASEINWLGTTNILLKIEDKCMCLFKR
jgi:hypothetical protein